MACQRTAVARGYVGMEPERNPELERMVDASLRALDQPGGEEILERMTDGVMSVPDGIVALLMLSGDYERR